MHPKLVEIAGWPINSYGFMIMIGFLLATYLGVRRGRELGIKSDLILDIGIISMIFGIIGAKINYVVQYPGEFTRSFRIFDFGDGSLHWAGALALGWIPFALWYWRTKDEKQLKLYSWQNGVLLVLTLFFALIGTRGLYVGLHYKEFDWTIFRTWQSGFVLYGGLITAVLVGALYTRMRGESVARLADLSAPLVMLGLAFGRVGCFLNGCCWGHITQSFIGIRFPTGSAPFAEQQRAGKIDFGATHSEPVLPTQLFETAVTLALFFALTWYDRKKKKNTGETMLLMGIGYAVWRFIVEFLRDDPRPAWLGDLTYSQTLSIGVLIVCGIWYFFVRTRPSELPALASQSTPAAAQESPAKTSDRR